MITLNKKFQSMIKRLKQQISFLEKILSQRTLIIIKLNAENKKLIE